MSKQYIDSQEHWEDSVNADYDLQKEHVREMQKQEDEKQQSQDERDKIAEDSAKLSAAAPELLRDLRSAIRVIYELADPEQQWVKQKIKGYEATIQKASK